MEPSSPPPPYGLFAKDQPGTVPLTQQPNGLLCAEIIPACLERGGMLSSSIYENFTTVVKRANDWLAQNPGYYLKTCETVEHGSMFDNAAVDVNTSINRLEGEGSNYFVRTLRLWLQVLPNPQAGSPQQIGFFDILPRVQPGVFKDDVLDRLDVVIAHANQTLISNPLPGRIITVETDAVKIGTDTLATSWKERGSHNPQFIYRLRIFYINGPPAMETVGVADFIPQMLTAGGLFEKPTFERFPSVLAKARQWIAAQPPAFSLLNVQTLSYKHNTADIDTLKMSYNEGNTRMHFVRYLRAAYVVRNHNAPGWNPTAHLRGPTQLDCKVFVPGMHGEQGCCETAAFECQLDVQRRISKWMKDSGAVLVSVETLPMRVFCGAEQYEGFDTMYTWNETHRRSGQHSQTVKSDQSFLTIYRVYVDGMYPDPVAAPGASVENYMQQQGGDCCTIS